MGNSASLMSYSSLRFVISLQMLLDFSIACRMSFPKGLPSILICWFIFFFLIIISIGRNPVSARRTVVGVPCGSWRISFSTPLKMAWICVLSSLVIFHSSDPYVMMGMMLVSISSHTALQFGLAPSVSVSFISLVSSCVGFQEEEERQTALPHVLYIGASYSH